MNNTERLVTEDPLTWEDAEVSSNWSVSLLTSIRDEDTPTLYPVIPLNPRRHPVNEFVVIPVYDIISSFIFSNPYSLGNPFVLGTGIVVSVESISEVILVSPTTTSGTKLSTFKYWSKLLIKSLGPPWNSWEI